MNLEKINHRYYWLKLTFFMTFIIIINAICMINFEATEPIVKTSVLLIFIPYILFLYFLGSLAKLFGKSIFTWVFLTWVGNTFGLIVAFLMMTNNVQVARRDKNFIEEINVNDTPDKKLRYGVLLLGLIAITALTAQIYVLMPQKFLPDFLKKYDSYGKTQVMTGLDRAVHIKKAVVDYWVKEQKFPRNNSEAGVSSPKFFNTYTDVVQSITVEEGGIIIILYYDRYEDIGFGNKTMILKPVNVNSKIIWDCTSGTVPRRLRSPDCRK